MSFSVLTYLNLCIFDIGKYAMWVEFAGFYHIYISCYRKIHIALQVGASHYCYVWIVHLLFIPEQISFGYDLIV